MRLGAYQAFEMTWVNSAFVNMHGIVIMIVQNHLGQTAEISTSILYLTPGANGTTYSVAFGLAPGEYSATFFAIITNGAVISASIPVSFRV
jgi:hypothetical protein